jgi:hypothetical protein
MTGIRSTLSKTDAVADNSFVEVKTSGATILIHQVLLLIEKI